MSSDCTPTAPRTSLLIKSLQESCLLVPIPIDSIIALGQPFYPSHCWPYSQKGLSNKFDKFKIQDLNLKAIRNFETYFDERAHAIYMTNIFIF